MSEFSVFLAGNTLISEPWPHVSDPAFERLVAEIRGADATAADLVRAEGADRREPRGWADRDLGAWFSLRRVCRPQPSG